MRISCADFIVRICTPLTLCTILLSKCGRCNARRFSSRWAVLAVLPIEEKKVSGSRYRIFTIKYYKIFGRLNNLCYICSVKE